MLRFQDLSMVTNAAYKLADIINSGRYNNILYFEFHEEVNPKKIYNCLEGLDAFTLKAEKYNKIFFSYGYVDDVPAIIHIAIKIADEWLISYDTGANYYGGYGPIGVLKLREACFKNNVIGFVSEEDFDEWLKNKFGISKKLSRADRKNIELRQFEVLIKALRYLTTDMQRRPEQFQSLKEENIRDFMLTPINTVVKGRGNAEAKNCKGKTDILIRTKDGLNEHIFELKVWSGIQTLKDAIFQLQSYLSWHNNHSGLIMFCYNLDYTSILNETKSFLSNNYNFEKRDNLIDNEFRIRLPHNTDQFKIIETCLIFVNLKTPIIKKSKK